jgi:LppP/LprE lipoprotein
VPTRLARAGLLLLAIFALSMPVAAQAASWLDEPPRGWNPPGAGVPPAPPTQNSDPRCAAGARTPGTPPEQAVAAAGWSLKDFWPPITSGNLELVTALADYDGMCRPNQFNVFVFSNGTYAGTLSAMNMNSRTDGVLDGTPSTAVQASDGRIEATFLRYAPSDPLCCASGGTSHVLYQIQQVQGQPVVVPTQITHAAAAAPAASAQVPARLPATGAADDTVPLPGLLALVGVGLLATGAALARPGARGSSRQG